MFKDREFNFTPGEAPVAPEVPVEGESEVKKTDNKNEAILQDIKNFATNADTKKDENSRSVVNDFYKSSVEDQEKRKNESSSDHIEE